MSPTRSQGSVPERIGHYRIERPLGAGAMGWVYLGKDTRDGAQVAVKLMHEHLALDKGFRDRFLREARLASRFRSPHVVRVLDHGQAGGRLFIVMQYVDGPSLAARLRRGRLSISDAVKVAAGVANALVEGEQLGVLHRDITPGNVLLSGGGDVKVADFGIAKDVPGLQYRSTSRVIGSMHYMAPERFVNKEGHRADIYSLGAVLFEALAGRPPFEGDHAALMFQHQEAEPPMRLLHRVPERLRNLVKRCLEKRPEDRPESAAEVVAELSAIGRERGFDLDAPLAASGAWRGWWRNIFGGRVGLRWAGWKPGVLLGSAGGIGLVLLAVLLLWDGPEPKPDDELAGVLPTSRATSVRSTTPGSGQVGSVAATPTGTGSASPPARSPAPTGAGGPSGAGEGDGGASPTVAISTTTPTQIPTPNPGASACQVNWRSGSVLAAEWHFDDGPGNATADDSGNGNHGIVHDAEKVVGKIGSARDFDGGQTYVRVADASGLDGMMALCVEAWVYPRAYPADGDGIVDKWGPGYVQDDSYHLFLDPNGRVHFAVADGREDFEGGRTEVASPDTLPLNTWSHLMGTYESGGSVRLWLNGSVIASIAATTLRIQDTGQDIWIGRSQAVPGNAFDGVIDEVRIFRD